MVKVIDCVDHRHSDCSVLRLSCEYSKSAWYNNQVKDLPGRIWFASVPVMNNQLKDVKDRGEHLPTPSEGIYEMSVLGITEPASTMG